MLRLATFSVDLILLLRIHLRQHPRKEEEVVVHPLVQEPKDRLEITQPLAAAATATAGLLVSDTHDTVDV